jgi:hypothetical protein
MIAIKSKMEAARDLAKMHFEVEEGLKQVFLLTSTNEEDPREPIKLLEIVEDAVESGIQPISFPPDTSRGIEYPSMIVELSTREFARLPDHNQIVFRDRAWHIGAELTPLV